MGAAYTAMVLAAIGLFLLIRDYGETLTAPAARPAAPGSAATTAAPEAFLHVLVALAAVLVTGRVLGRIFRSMGQPPVIGEVLAGIVLGPSALGRLAPGVSALILPPSAAPLLGVIAQIGVVLYMFLVGLGLNVERLRDRAHAIVITAHASIVAPFILGSLLALYLYPRLSSGDVPFTSFALFVGVAMSITAFPVLARILSDRGMSTTELGVVSLACAAVGDVTAWCLLAFVVGVARARMLHALMVATLAVGFIGVMVLAVRPAIASFVARSGDPSPGLAASAMALAGVGLCALTAERIGIHAIFGAFMFGAVVPHASRLARALISMLEGTVTIFLLPAFFAFSGMRTQIGLVSTSAEWAMCGLIILVATAGKFGGTLVAARFTRMGWRDAASLGILMNTRGLMELIVLNIGLDLGVISSALFTMMVLMALVTTIATTPVLDALVPSPVRYNRRT